VEAVYKKSSLVEQIWVYGNSFESILVAVVVPNEDTLKTWAAQNGMEGAFAAICRDRRTHDYLSSELAQTAKAGKLKVLGPSHHGSSGLKPHQAKYDNLDCVIPLNIAFTVDQSTCRSLLHAQLLHSCAPACLAKLKKVLRSYTQLFLLAGMGMTS